MYKKVYIAIDESEFSKQALAVAIKMAQIFNSSLCIAHCISSDDSSSQETGRKVLEKARVNINDISIETKLLIADEQYGLNGISLAIAESATDWKADLLVVGTSNRKGLDRFFSGSVAEELVRKVDCSIMLVRIN
ncbi:universal stress protein [Nitrosomonas sp.]|uniref:universal stress protein n=1 Tax=Nitrosomonas sp. TaxID=42353 RepID=UPI001DD61F28|nr:universal stress protein [Nitrosomonas sp.]MBX3616542.1 universal stress protein [Nitrosomonas sp.]